MTELEIRTSFNPAWQAQGPAAAQAALPDGLRRLHRAVLGHFLETGGPPDRSWLDDTATRLGIDPDPARAALAAADLVHVDSGRVRVAYPFSGVPTGHRVRLAGGPEVWAMCAIDALGIPQMTGRDATITAADPHAGDPVRVDLAGPSWQWSPPSAVVLWAYAQERPGEHAALCSCPHVNFVTSPDHAGAYLAGHPGLTGHLIGQRAAVELGRALFGPLLDGTFTPGTQGSQTLRQATP